MTLVLLFIQLCELLAIIYLILVVRVQWRNTKRLHFYTKYLWRTRQRETKTDDQDVA